MQYLTPQQLHPLVVLRRLFPKNIAGDTNAREFEAIHMLRMGRY